jgi:SH3-like domain-containing protein
MGIFCSRAGAYLGILACATMAGAGAATADPLGGRAAAALPMPRFVSLKSDHVNVRGGPDKDHEVVRIYTKSGVPVEITAEFDNWRRVRDWDGDEGWVYHSLLSGRRTVLVAPTVKNKRELLPLFDRPDQRGAIVARLEPRVMGSVKRCTGTWCRISGKGFDGWIQQGRLWGVYPNEQID